MKLELKIALAATVLTLAGCTAKNDIHLTEKTEKADLIFINAAVYTVDNERRWAEAVAIKNNIISFVGDNKSAKAFIGPNTKISDLGGKMLLPGFQDTHIHTVTSGVKYLQCSLFGLKDIDALLEKIKSCADKNPDAPWIRGGGWTLSSFMPAGMPDKKQLDKVVPHQAVYLQSIDGHTVWLNSKALALAGIDITTNDPKGGRIDRYPGTNEPSGTLQEIPAMRLADRVVPPISIKELTDGLRYSQQLLNSFGITAAKDARVATTFGTDAYGLPAYEALQNSGELTLRVVTSLHWINGRSVEDQLPGLIAARKRYTHGNINANTIKIKQDGVADMKTVQLLEPFSDGPEGFRGHMMNEPDVLNEAVAALDKAGFQIHVHINGDAGIRYTLDAFEKARALNGSRDSRHQMAHLKVVHPDDIPRFSALGINATFQPLWGHYDPNDLDFVVLGPERSHRLYPLGEIHRAGTIVSFGSDWYVSTPNPLHGLEVAVTRRHVDKVEGKTLGENQQISLADAIESYTINGAYVNFMEDKTGSIEVGKWADLVILDKNLFLIHPSEISDVKVTTTLFNGKVVYGKLP